jgi:hypothetical protein
MVRILIREGQNPNERSQTAYNTPLHIAAKHGFKLIVKFLLSQGAVTNIPNAYGQLPVDMVQESIDLITSQVMHKKMKPQSIGGLSVEQQRQDAAVMLKNMEEVREILIVNAPQPKQVQDSDDN